MTKIWDRYFLDLAYQIAINSKDPHYKTGCAITTAPPERAIVSTGLNGPPMGINDDIPERFERPEKYHWMEHAERNAIYLAARRGGSSLRGCTIYQPSWPCMDCARAICQVGITELVMHKEAVPHSGHADVEDRVKQLFKEAGVNWRFVSYDR